MRLAFFSGIGGPVTGTGVHVTNLLRHLLALRPEGEFVSFRSSVRGAAWHRASVREIDPSGRIEARTVPIPSRALHLTQTYLRFPPMAALLGGRYDIYHQMWVSTDPAAPSRKLVVTMYDTASLVWPGQDGALFRGAGGLLRRAAAVTTLSEYSKQRIVDAFGVEPARVHVTYSGCDAGVYHTGYAREETDGVLDELGVPRPYLFFIGGQTPRKNLPRIIGAFALARGRGRLPHRLVLAGPLQPLRAEVAEAVAASGCGDAVRILGYVPQAAVPHLYRGADALLFPTLFEGFGLPVVEAMACATPVVTSTATSLPEVAGDAAELVDPASPEAIAEGILALLREGGEARAARLARGIAQARKFSWQRCAARHLLVYDEVIARARDARPAKKGSLE